MATVTRQGLGLLASVRDLDEVALVLAAGVPLIDLKEPARGALGAVAPDLIRDAVSLVAGRALVSATIGDTPTDADELQNRVRAIGDCGVDFVKIGLLADETLPSALAAMAPLSDRYRLVAVLLADRARPTPQTLQAIADAGFAGAMLDTEDKARGALPQIIPPQELTAFVRAARERDLLTGLAGSLRLVDIPLLAPLGVDYLGFRGGLCDGGRVSALNAEKVRKAMAALTAPTARTA